MSTLHGVPQTRQESVVEELHGVQVADPYRWLEDPGSKETEHWVEEQNAYSRALLDAVPGREGIRDRVTALLSIGSVTAPRVRHGRCFYVRREGTQNQPILYLRETRDGKERVLLDPNVVHAEGMVALDWWYPSHDGRLLAYGLSQNGDEWSTLHVLDVDSGQVLPDRIPRTRHSSVAWLADSTGFFYTRYPDPETVASGEENYHVRFYFHRLGAMPTDDAEVHVTDLEREDMLWLGVSPDGRYLTAGVYKGWERSNLYLRDLHAQDASFIPVAVGQDALFTGSVVDGTLFIHTNMDAPKYRMFRAPAATPQQEHWEKIIPEAPNAVLDAFALVGGRLALHYLENAVSSITLVNTNGEQRSDVRLPTLGTVTAITGEWDRATAFFSFESFTVPPAVYSLDCNTAEISTWTAVDAPLRSADFDVSQEWFSSQDGTRISMFVVRRRDLDRSRPHPTLLTGYGGFNISRTPMFMRSMYLWLERGGVFALPNLRGGGEYGEAWHRAGMLEHKQNVFDDFIAAAQHLIASGYTTPSSLAIQGGSNGGLLVGAALTQRPELFRAVVCAVPLLDMLRYHRFLIARLWIPEYGSADDPKQFPFLHAYSPYHRVQDGTRYPAVLLMAAESDSRVDPVHARKMAARLQAATSSGHPILMRIETRAGHGVGKPLTKVIDEQTDMWSFLFWQMGLTA